MGTASADGYSSISSSGTASLVAASPVASVIGRIYVALHCGPDPAGADGPLSGRSARAQLPTKRPDLALVSVRRTEKVTPL